MIVVDITARRHIVAKPENREANFASAALIAFARSGALGPRVDADPWAERHRPAAPCQIGSQK